MASATENIWLSVVELAHPIPGWVPAASHSNLMGKVSVYANGAVRMSLSLRHSERLQLARTLQNAMNKTNQRTPATFHHFCLEPIPYLCSSKPHRQIPFVQFLPLPLEHILVCSSPTPTFKAMPLPSKVTFDSYSK